MPPVAKKGAKKSVKRRAGGKKGKGGKKAPHRSFNSYIGRIIRQIHGTSCGVSSSGMAVLNSFVTEMFNRVAGEAGALVRAGKTRTMGPKEVAAAVRLSLPGELGRNAAVDASRTVARYSENS